MNIVSEEIISDLEADDILEKREKEGELKYEQKNALEILRKFKMTDVNKIKNIITLSLLLFYTANEPQPPWQQARTSY